MAQHVETLKTDYPLQQHELDELAQWLVTSLR
jgi:lipoate-protein ligase A